MAKLLNFFSNNQNPGEFEVLIKPHIGHLYRVAYRLTRQAEAAEDLLQDLMLHFYPKCHELKQIENLKPWLTRSLYNRFIDNIRKNKRNPVTDAENDSVLAVVIDYAEAPERETEQELMQQRLSQALEQLNEDQRRVVMLHDMEGYTLTELAEVMSTPVGTLKSRLHRARSRIREALSVEPSELIIRIKD
ncbi:MAG: sigma-70 family RNA polymerase sigma factor [Gammaproteobacteria bacterium]|nr:sigma-70 family RNA polymerase sigma factor [Gammaproteobacteria bacterium]